MLRADQVLAVGRVLWDGKLNPVFAPGAPGILRKVFALIAHARLEDLEPVTVPFVCLRGARSLGHINELRSRVLHRRAHGQLHSDLRAGLDFHSLRAAGTLESSLVATEIKHIRSHVVADIVPLGRVVFGLARVLANILERLGLLAINDELVKEVMSRDRLHQGGSSNDRVGELHGE